MVSVSTRLPWNRSAVLLALLLASGTGCGSETTSNPAIVSDAGDTRADSGETPDTHSDTSEADTLENDAQSVPDAATDTLTPRDVAAELRDTETDTSDEDGNTLPDTDLPPDTDPTAICGNGVPEPGEACDTASPAVTCVYNDRTCGVCADDCASVLLANNGFCGDGVLDDGEVCDDGAGNASVGGCSPLDCNGTLDQVSPPESWTERFFGETPAISNDWLAVGQSGTTVMGASAAGTVYVWRRETGSTYVFDTQIEAPLPSNFGRFGGAIVFSAGQMIVSARGSSETGVREGAVYVFERQDGAWAIVQTITPDLGGSEPEFGENLVVEGDRLVVTADRWSHSGGTGAAWVYERDAEGVWSEAATLLPTGESSLRQYGCEVALNGDLVAVTDCEINSYAGAVWVFEKVEGEWTQVYRADGDPVPAETTNGFGRAVALPGEGVLVVGSPLTPGGGRVSAWYRNDAGEWSEAGPLLPSDAGPRENFGSLLASVNGRLYVGVGLGTGSTSRPATQVFRFDGMGWQSQGELPAPGFVGGGGQPGAMAVGDGYLVRTDQRSSVFGTSRGVIVVY